MVLPFDTHRHDSSSDVATVLLSVTGEPFWGGALRWVPLTSRPLVLTGGAAMMGVPWLLRRMASDFEESGALRPRTALWLYTTYAVHAAAYGWALRRGGHRPVGSHPARLALGSVAAAAGAGMSLAGIGRFTDAAQVSGIRAGPFITGGVYRFSRNPQYTGYTLALGGAALARRSVPAMALATAAGAVFARWVPAEERYLARSVGAPYERYRAVTPRWLGWRRRR